MIEYVDGPVTYIDSNGVEQTEVVSCFQVGIHVFEVKTSHLPAEEINDYLQGLLDQAVALH